jgi:hypothetical protein
MPNEDDMVEGQQPEHRKDTAKHSTLISPIQGSEDGAYPVIETKLERDEAATAKVHQQGLGYGITESASASGHPIHESALEVDSAEDSAVR